MWRKTDSSWERIKSVWRKTDSSWERIRTAWRKTDGSWELVFGGIGVPIPKSGFSPLLYVVNPNGTETTSLDINAAILSNQTSPTAYDGDEIYLTRGRWTQEPLSFFMRIQKSQDPGFDSGITLANTASSATKTYLEYSDSNHEDQVPLSSANRHIITIDEVRDGYYFRGKVEATNSDDLTGIYATDLVLPRIYADVNFNQNLDNSYGTSIQTNGGTFTWSYIGNSTIQAQDISEQQFLVYPLNNTSGNALYSTTIFPGTGTSAPTTTVTFTSANLSPNTQFTVVIKTTMQDGWASNSTIALRTIVSDQVNFTTAAAKPLAPTNVTGTDVGTNRPFNNGAVSLSWSQSSNGVSVVGYKIEYSVGPDYLVYSVLVSNTGNSSTSGTFTELDSDKNYKFVITAIGVEQNSDPSADSNAVLITTVPREPNGISAVAGDALANVSFTASNFNGGKTVIDFRATSNPDNLTDSNNFSPIEVTGLTNYTSYTFTVAARNANGYSIESVASSAVTPTMPAPVGSGTVTIASQSNASYIYQITSYGTWSNSPTSYDYEWQTSSDGGANWTTRSSGTDVATIPDYNASSYKAQNIRLRVYGRNQTGPAISPLTSNTLFIFYTSPVITSLTVTGGAGLLIWNFSFTADDPVVDIDLEYKLSSSSTYTLIPVTTTSGQEIVSAGTYDFRVFITNSVNGGFRSDFETVTNIVVTGAPTASGFANSDSTIIPSQPSTLSFSSNNNQVTTSWTNGSPITSVNFAASGAGVNTNYTDSSAPFTTSDLSPYSSSGTYTATVTNFNNSLRARASWNQSNSQSYKVHYSSSEFGTEETNIENNSASSVNHDIGWSSGAGSFTFQAVTLYSGANGTGTSKFVPTGIDAVNGITPSQKSSSRSGSTSLTYQLPNLITNPAYGGATSNSSGWTASISTQPNPTGGTYSVVSVTAGSASVNSSTGALTASGLSAGQSSTVTVRYSRSGYNSVDISRSGSALAGSAPSGGGVTLSPSGTQQAGTTITANVSAASGTSPISYFTTLRKKTGSAPTSNTDGTQVASGGGTGNVASHTITAFEASSPADQFRAFTTRTNSVSSNVVASNTVIATPAASTPATQPGTPGTPTNGWTGGTTYPFSWTAPAAGTVAGGGAATITNYSMRIYEATNSSGTGATLRSTFNTGSGSSSYTYTSPNAALYYAASVAAINSAGLQGPYSGISQYR